MWRARGRLNEACLSLLLLTQPNNAKSVSSKQYIMQKSGENNHKVSFTLAIFQCRPNILSGFNSTQKLGRETKPLYSYLYSPKLRWGTSDYSNTPLDIWTQSTKKLKLIGWESQNYIFKSIFYKTNQCGTISCSDIRVITSSEMNVIQYTTKQGN